MSAENRLEVLKSIRSAIKKNDVRAVLALIGNDPERQKMTTPFGTWLHEAVTFSTLDMVKALVQLGVDVNGQVEDVEGSALHCAAGEGKPDFVRYLHEQGAEFDTSEPTRNPLFAAIVGGNHGHTTEGHTAVARYLIDAGIDLKPKYRMSDGVERDALAQAKLWGRSEIAKMIEAKLAG